MRLWKGIFYGSLFVLISSVMVLIKEAFSQSLHWIDIMLFITITPIFIFSFNKYYLKFYRKGKLLQKEKWFQDLTESQGFIFTYNLANQDFIEKSNVKKILADPAETEKFEQELRELIYKENV